MCAGPGGRTLQGSPRLWASWPAPPGLCAPAWAVASMDAPCIVASLCCVVRCTVETFLRAHAFGTRGVLLDAVALRRFLDAVYAAAVDFFVQTGRPVPDGGPPVLGMVSPGGPRAAEQRAAAAPGAPRRGQGWLDLGPYPPRLGARALRWLDAR